MSNIPELNRQYAILTDNKNRAVEKPPEFDPNAQIWYLSIKRGDVWEPSLEHTDRAYVDGKGAEWLKNGLIDDYSVGYNRIGSRI